MPDPAAEVTERVRERFVEHWGSMAGSWGINPAMGRIHGLLYILGRPMNAEEVMDALQLSRAAVSMNLRDLINWGVVRRVHRKGDRKEYFESETDVWEMFTTIIRERKRREVDPTLQALEACMGELAAVTVASGAAPAPAGTDGKPAADSQTAPATGERVDGPGLRTRLGAMLDFLRTVDRVFRFLDRMGKDQVQGLLRLAPDLPVPPTPQSAAPASSPPPAGRQP